MSDPYLGEIRMFGGPFAPLGWAFCDGSSVSISDNPTLFQLIGTTYGGDGVNQFNLPDLRGRLPIHQGTGFGATYTLGQNSGSETVTLNQNTTPTHSHPLMGSQSNGGTSSPQNVVLASNTTLQPYLLRNVDTPMAGSSVSMVGGSQPHSNIQPYLCVNFIIATSGNYPSQN